MAKKKYKFNPDTLSYERVGISLKEKSTKILAYFSSSLALALIIVVVIINAYETPKTKALKRHSQGSIMIFLKLVFLFAERVKLHFTSPILSLTQAVVGHHLMMKLKMQLLDMKI